MERELDLSLLRTFLTVATTGSFTTTSLRLCRTQPAISQRIKRLEDMVAQPLIRRSASGMSLTREGEILLVYAKRMLTLNDEAIHHMVAPQPREVIRLGVPEEYTSTGLDRVLAQFSAEHPNISITIDVAAGSELDNGFRDGRLDVALTKSRSGPEREGTAHRRRLLWVTAASRKIHQGAPLPLVLRPEGCQYRQAALEVLSEAGMGWEIVCTSSSWAGLRSGLLAGLGISAVPREMLSPTLRVLDSADGMPTLPDTLLTLRSRAQPPSPARQRFAELLEDSLCRDD
jgi:DNA-binding transcriptional LysR family regulator